MQILTYWLNHAPSNSRALVEFILKDQKVKMNGVAFASGNVIDINSVRACRRNAEMILHYGGPDLPPDSPHMG